jgi:hypothetical protein
MRQFYPRSKVAWNVHLERFHNSRALTGIMQGGPFSMKGPLNGSGSGVQQLWSRYSRKEKPITGVPVFDNERSVSGVDMPG